MAAEDQSYPKTLRAVRKDDGAQWSIGDALLEEIGPRSRAKKQDVAFKQCAGWLAERNFDYKPTTLRIFRDTAAAFPAESRVPGVSWKAHAVAADEPKALAHALEESEETGKPVTKRAVERKKKALKSSKRKRAIPQKKSTKKATQSKADQKADEAAAAETPEPTRTEVDREQELLELTHYADEASKLGRMLRSRITEVELSDEDRSDLAADIRKVATTWAMLAEFVENPVTDEALQRLLEGTS